MDLESAPGGQQIGETPALSARPSSPPSTLAALEQVLFVIDELKSSKALKSTAVYSQKHSTFLMKARAIQTGKSSTLNSSSCEQVSALSLLVVAQELLPSLRLKLW